MKVIQIYLFHVPRLLLVLGMVLLNSLGYCQDDPMMIFEGKVKDESGKSISGATVKILRNGKEVLSATTNASGEINSYSDYYGYVYKIIVSKDGLTTNTIEINSKEGYHEEDVPLEIIIPIKVELVTKQNGVDYGIIENTPIEKFKIDPTTGQLSEDFNYIDQRKDEIKDYFKQLTSNEKEKQKRFQELKKSGEQAMLKKDYGKAIKDWKAALDIKDDEPLTEKLVDAEFAYKDILKEKELQEKMKQLLKEGDELVQLLKFENAREKYEAAQRVLPKNKEPQIKLDEIDKKIESLENEKANKIYIELMKRAEIKVSSENYPAAIALFNEAQIAKPKEKDPAKRIKEVEKIVADLAKNKADYDQTMITANGLLSAKEYEKAKATFDKASQFLPGETLPKEKIKEIDLILEKIKKEEAEYNKFIASADKHYGEEKYEEAVLEYKKAVEIKPNESKPAQQIEKAKLKIAELKKLEADYKAQLEIANGFFDKKQYKESIGAYEQALLFKKEETFPKEQIEKAKSEIAKQEQIEKEYLASIKTGEELFSKKEYEKSILSFTEASKLKPNENLPKEKIGLAKAEIEKLRLIDETFAKFMSEGESQFSQKNYEEALLKYKEAQRTKPNENSAQIKISEVEKAIAAAKKLEEDYQTALTTGNDKLASTNYTQAIQSYEDALKLKPEAIEPKTKIKEAQNALAKIKKLEEDYKSAMNKGNDLLKTDKFEESIIAFEEAKELKQTATEPQIGIDLAKEGIKAREEAEEARKKAEEAERLAQLAKEKAEKEAAEKAAKEEAEAKRIAEEKAKQEAEAKAALEAERLAKLAKEKEEQRLAQEQAQKEAAEQKAKEEAEAKKQEEERQRLANLAKQQEAKAKAALEAEKAKLAAQEAERLAKLKEAEEKAKKEAADRKAQQQAEAEKAATEKAKREEEARKLEEEKKAQEKAEQERLEQEQARKDAEEKAKLEAEAAAREAAKAKQAEELARKAQEEKAKLEAEQERKRQEELQRQNAEEEKRKAQEAQRLAREKELLAAEQAKKDAAEAAKKQAENLRNIEKEKQYLSFISRADEQFDKGDYRGAKNTYNSALSLKPNESYPKGRIEAINVILANMSESERNAITSTDDYFNIDAEMYGTEVDMTGKDGSFLLTKIEDNSDLREYMNLMEYIDSTNYENKKQGLKDENLALFTYSQFETLKDKINRELGVNDYARHGNITSVSLFLDASKIQEKEDLLEDKQKSQANSDEIEKLKLEIGKEKAELKKRNEVTISEYHKYLDSESELSKINGVENTQETYETYVQIEELKTKFGADFELNGTKYRQRDATLEILKEKMNNQSTQLSEKEKLSLKAEIDYLEETNQLIRKSAEKGQNNILKNQHIYEDYIDKKAKENEAATEKIDERIEMNMEELALLEEKRITNTYNENQDVLASTEAYKKYEDEQNEISKEIQSKEILSQRSVTSSFEKVEEIKNESNKKAQEKALQNTNEFLAIEDNIAKSQDGIQQRNSDKILATTNEFEKLRAQKDEEAKKQNDGANEKAEELKKFIEKKAEAEKEAILKSKDISLAKSAAINAIDAEKTVPKSAGNKDKLALIFPVGVTQKVYQKKNEFGEITSITTRRVVVTGNKGDDYIHKKTKAGNFYFKNGKSITEGTWDLETSGEIVNK